MFYLKQIIAFSLLLTSINLDARNWFPRINGNLIKINSHGQLKLDGSNKDDWEIGTAIPNGCIIKQEDGVWKIRVDSDNDKNGTYKFASALELFYIEEYLKEHDLLKSLKKYPDLIDAVNSNNPAATQDLISYKQKTLSNLEFFRFFNAHAEKINGINPTNVTALLLALNNGNFEMVDILVESAKKYLTVDQFFSFINTYGFYYGHFGIEWGCTALDRIILKSGHQKNFTIAKNFINVVKEKLLPTHPQLFFDFLNTSGRLQGETPLMASVGIAIFEKNLTPLRSFINLAKESLLPVAPLLYAQLIISQTNETALTFTEVIARKLRYENSYESCADIVLNVIEILITEVRQAGVIILSPPHD